jgi:hypothetical protein
MATPNPFEGTEDEVNWTTGYEDGRLDPKRLFGKPPSPLTDDGAEAWKAGFKAGQRDYKLEEQEAEEKLLAEETAAKEPVAQAPHQAAASQAAATGEHHEEVHPVAAGATEVPASFSVHNLPAFRFNLPTGPLDETVVETGTATVVVKLGVRGSVMISFEDPIKGASFDQNGLRIEAVKALGPITEGMRVSGIPGNPSIGVTMGSQYDTTEVRYVPPSTMVYIGQVKIGYTVPSPAGPIAVQGQPGFQMEVTVIPHEPPASEPATEEEFQDSHKEVWEAIAVMAGIAIVAVALAPETGGASLSLLAFE